MIIQVEEVKCVYYRFKFLHFAGLSRALQIFSILLSADAGLLLIRILVLIDAMFRQ